MFHQFRVCHVMALIALAGCQSTDAARLPSPAQGGTHLAEAPPGADPGSCWARDASPAVVETVTEQILVQPAQVASDGTVITPAAYRTETRQAIVKKREDTVFETPCADALTPDFVASLQRALSARGVYRGPISGVMDARTRGAVRRYQKPFGLDSGIVSLASARQLGLVAQERPQPQE